MNSKKVIVTGVTGQDGSYMVDFLLKNTSCEVYGMVRRSSNPNLNNLNGSRKNPRFHLVVGDLSDAQSINNLVQEIKPSYFINLAAQSFVGSSWTLPEQTFDVDAVGVMRCLEAIRKYSPSCRFYNAGSSEEFGDVRVSPQDENHPLRARSPYGASKIAARQIVKVWRESYQLYAVQGILFNHESERRGEEFVTRKISMGVARIKKAIEAGEPFSPIVLGNLEAKRDWSHAEDFVRGIWMMLNQEKHVEELKVKVYEENVKGGILLPFIAEEQNSKILSSCVKEYVLSSNETHSVREFIEKAFAAAGIRAYDNNKQRLQPCNDVRSQQINYSTVNGVPLVVVSQEFYRPAEVELLYGNSSLARKELGWKPEISFDELVTRMVENDIRLLTETSERI